MERLSYEDYTKYGGKASIDDFPLFIVDVEQHLKRYTFNRIDKYPLTPQIKRLMVRIIDDVLIKQVNLNPAISSYSDGIESITYNNEFHSIYTATKINGLCKLYLPDELIYRGGRYKCVEQ